MRKNTNIINAYPRELKKSLKRVEKTVKLLIKGKITESEALSIIKEETKQQKEWNKILKEGE